MNRRERGALQALREATSVPAPHSGKGTKSASLSGHIAYARDAQTALNIWQAGSLALGVGDDWQGWVDAPFGSILGAAEAWHVRRTEQGWNSDGARALTVAELLEVRP